MYFTRAYFKGGLLGHWSVWTASAIKQFERCKAARGKDTLPADLLALDARVTDCNSAFFDVANHPEMRFVSKKIVGDPSDEFKIVGDLTIRGTTHEVTLDASMQGRGMDPWGNERAGFEAKGKINRADFGLAWNAALETGGVVVGDEVKISIDVELIKQKSE